jgi:replication-associated recombination protein RarA
MAPGTLFAMESQQSIAFPQSLCEEFKPQRIVDFVGLDRNKRILSAFVKNPKPCALLFNGPSGCGKTAMAEAVARELDATVWRIPSQECNVAKITEVSAHCSYIPKAGLKGFHLVICDECSEMSNAARLAFLSKLDGSDPVPQTIWIFTANDAYERLPETFLSRCAIKLDFSSYGSSEEIISLMQRIWMAKAGSAPAPNWKKLICGNVRESIARLETEILAV